MCCPCGPQQQQHQQQQHGPGLNYTDFPMRGGTNPSLNATYPLSAHSSTSQSLPRFRPRQRSPLNSNCSSQSTTSSYLSQTSNNKNTGQGMNKTFDPQRYAEASTILIKRNAGFVPAQQNPGTNPFLQNSNNNFDPQQSTGTNTIQQGKNDSSKLQFQRTAGPSIPNGNLEFDPQQFREISSPIRTNSVEFDRNQFKKSSSPLRKSINFDTQQIEGTGITLQNKDVMSNNNMTDPNSQAPVITVTITSDPNDANKGQDINIDFDPQHFTGTSSQLRAKGATTSDGSDHGLNISGIAQQASQNANRALDLNDSCSQIPLHLATNEFWSPGGTSSSSNDSQVHAIDLNSQVIYDLNRSNLGQDIFQKLLKNCAEIC